MIIEEFITRRTDIISRMLDNPDKYGIYPTTECFKELDILFQDVSKAQRDKTFEEAMVILKNFVKDIKKIKGE